MAPAIPTSRSPTYTSTIISPSPEGGILPERSLLDCLQDLRSAIWHRRPILGEIKQKHGWKTLHRYSQDFLDVNPSPHLDARKGELIAVVKELLAARLGANVAGEVAAQLERCALVSTTDHHCIIHHPFWVNANIISAIPYTGKTEQELKYLVVFSFAGVSLNNASGYPRGIAFHGGINGSGNVIRLPILPDKHKMSTVYATRAFTREDLDRAQSALQKKMKVGEVVEQRGTGVARLMEEQLGAVDVLEGKDLCSQITTVNYRLWPKLFHTSKTIKKKSTSMRKIPDLIYLEIETLVRELLLRHHLNNAESMIGKLLFHSEWRRLALEHFDGIHGAFHQDSASGTYFFWGVDPSGHRVRLHIDGEYLVSQGGTIRVGLTPEGIKEALITRKIFPSMLLSYLMVSLYYGFKCLGGFCQVHDLTMTKKAWQTMLRRMGEQEEVDAVEPVQTKELGGDGMVLSYFETKQGNLIPATGIDMALDDIDTSFAMFVDMSRKLALEEAMQPMLPEMYTVLYTNDERDPVLAGIKPERIMETTGLQEKLHKEIVRREIATSGLDRITVIPQKSHAEDFLARMRPITTADRSIIQRYLKEFPQSVCELTFGNFFLWGESREHRYVEYEGHLLVTLKKQGEARMWYQPIGPDPAQLMREDLTPEKGYRWYCVDTVVAEKLPQSIPMALALERFDYVYDLAALRSLAGGAYIKHRNRIKQCMKCAPEIFALGPEHAAECSAMLDQWMRGDHEGMASAIDEIVALKLAMENWKTMELLGVGIRIGGSLQAFAFGAPMTETMFLENFEKSTGKFPGLYQLILHEFAKAVPAHYTDLNREEDLGIPGLRVAKEGWSPKHLVKKYMVG